jgi:P27 family predicted phage terminase small subunit
LLRCYCEAYSRYVEAQRAVAAGEQVVDGARGQGERVRNPWAMIVRANAEQVRQFARELGIGPASRASLQVDPGTAPTLADIGLPPRLRVVGAATVSGAPEEGA